MRFYVRRDLRGRIAAAVAAAAMTVGGVFCLGDGELVNRFFLYNGAPFYVSAQKADGAGEGGETEGGDGQGGDSTAEQFEESGGNALISDDTGGSRSATGVVGSVLYKADAIGGEGGDGHEKAFADGSALMPYSIEELRDFEFLKKNLYTANPDTALLPSDIDIDDVLSRDFRLAAGVSGPQVLIFHTHMYESFAGSDEDDINQGVYGAGERLAQNLAARGIEVLHIGERFDMVNGSVQVFGAYERMEPVIKRILAENPSIEVCIDLHRDGVTTLEPATAVVNGRRAARVMFFNGLSRVKEGNSVTPIAGLDNPNLRDNLAFSLRLLLSSESLYKGFAKKIFLKPHRFSLHMLPKSMLVELGNQNNTLDEALYAMDLLADVIYDAAGR